MKEHQNIDTDLVCEEETTWQHLGRDQRRWPLLEVSHSLHYTHSSTLAEVWQMQSTNHQQLTA